MKKNFFDVMSNRTMDVLVGMYAEHDEKTILPLMLAVEDIVLAYMKRKYGEVVSLEELMKLKADVRCMEGEYVLTDEEYEMYDTFSSSLKPRKEIKDDEIPFS